MLYQVPYRRLDGVRATYWLSTSSRVARKVVEAIKPKEQVYAKHHLPKAA